MRRGLVFAFAVASSGPSLLAASELPALAQAADANKSEARQRFDRGLSLFNDGDNAGALAEFKRAYELVPNPLVLFNVGLVYAQMGRPVDAVASLDALLAAPGTLASDKLARAKTTRDEQAARIAEVTITTTVPATLQIDNVEVGTTPLAAALKVAGGVHTVGALATGYAPARKEITVAGGQKADVALELVQMQGRVAHLTLKTHLPAADVVIDDQPAGKTPMGQSLTMAPGPHKIELRRAGYNTASQNVTLGEGASGEVTLEPEEDRSATVSNGGTLALDVSEAQAVVTIDGKERGVYATVIRLPPGLHRLLVERGGFQPAERDVTVDAGRSTTVRLALDPTPETRAAYVGHVSSQRTWGLVTLVGGTVIAVGSGVLLAWNAGQKSSAQNDVNAGGVLNDQCVANGNLVNGMMIPDCKAMYIDDPQSRLDAANARNLIGFIGAGAGLAAATVGLVLLATNDSLHKYDAPSSGEMASRAKPRFQPLAWALPGGAGRGAGGGGVGLAGTF